MSTVIVSFSEKPHFANVALPLQEIYIFTKDLLELRKDVYINYRLWDTGTEDNEDYLESIENNFDVKIKRVVDLENIKSKKILEKQ